MQENSVLVAERAPRISNLVKLLERVQPEHTGSVESARDVWHSFRLANGRKSYQPLLTPPPHNAKFAKTERHDHVYVYGLSLAPDKSSGTHAVCPYSTPQCRSGCVAFAGRGGQTGPKSPHVARTLRTQFLARFPNEFTTLVYEEVYAALMRHGSGALRVRLNAFSDIPWERVAPWMLRSNVKFYDYTKWPIGTRGDYVDRTGTRLMPGNDHLTYSVSEKFDTSEMYRLHRGRSSYEDVNLAVVFDVRRGDPLPDRYMGRDAIGRDHSDDRWNDPHGVIVGLRAKGKAKSLTVGGFVKEA